MYAVILAGGLGTRISEETHLKPKPMIEIGGKPILWHIMKTFSNYGFNKFIICCGYKGYVIKEYFANYFLHTSDVTFKMINNEITIHDRTTEPWEVTLVDTGETTMTGGRLKRIKKYLNNEPFFFTYGDGLANISISDLLNCHKSKNKMATITAVQPPGRFGSLKIDSNSNIIGFQEKPEGDGGWINGGFFVLEPRVIEMIESDQTTWEKEPLENLAMEDQLNIFFHKGFWRPMDTLRDKEYLNKLWEKSNAPWKIWDS